MSDAHNLSSPPTVPPPRPGVSTLVTEFDPDDDAPEQLQSTLTVLSGAHPGAVFHLNQATHIIGRDPDTSISLDDPGLSRQHARISRTDHGDFLEDMRSTNGTFINGTALRGAHKLEDGDRIQLGQKTILRFSLQDRLEQEAAQRMYEMTVRDPLTQLYNRRHLDERLSGEFAYASRHRAELCVLMIDVDYFKRLNDTEGHLAGDEALRGLAQALLTIVRAEDMVARYGGEEFAVVARGIDANGAVAFAERIRTYVQGCPIPWHGRQLHISVSIGVAHCMGKQYSSVEALMAAADGALYQAKANGRNRVCLADLEEEHPPLMLPDSPVDDRRRALRVRQATKPIKPFEG